MDNETLNLFNEIEDEGVAKFILERVQKISTRRVITKGFFVDHLDSIRKILSEVPQGMNENKKIVEKFKIKLGVSVEISKEIEVSKLKIDGDIFYADEHMAALGFGTGADGAYSNGGDLNQNNIYNFTSFSLTNTITTTSTSGKPIYILVQGNCTISGTINFNSCAINPKLWFPVSL